MSIRNAKIVAVNADPNLYHSQKVEDRGKPDFVMSSSSIREFHRHPSKWKNGYSLPPSTSLIYGNLFDCLVLTPSEFDKRYAVQPDTYIHKALKCPTCGSVSDAASCRKCKQERIPCEISKPWSNQSDTCSAWVEEQQKAGRVVVSQEMMKNAVAARLRLLADERCRSFLESCQTQVLITAEWHDPDTGLIIPLQALLDLVSKSDSLFPKSLGDLKTTRDASIIGWQKSAEALGYDVQAAWNNDMFVAATQREIVDFCFIISENEFPFEIGRRYFSQDLLEPKMDSGMIASGRRQYEQMLKDYALSVKTGFFPGFDDTDESGNGWTLVTPSPWAEQRRLFAPKLQFGGEKKDSMPEMPEDPAGDITP